MTSDLLRAVVEGMPKGFAGPDDDVAATRAAMAPLHGHPLDPDTRVDTSVPSALATRSASETMKPPPTE